MLETPPSMFETNTQTPCFEKKRRLIDDSDDEDDEDDEDHTEVVQDHGGIHVHTVSKSCLGGYKSALVTNLLFFRK